MEKKTTGKVVAYIYSTASNDQMITNYSEVAEGAVSVITGQVLIMGGANIMPHGNRSALITPRGACTPVNAKEMEILEQNKSFKQFVSDRYMTVSTKQEDAEKVAKGELEDRDESSPVLEAGVTKGGKKQPKQKNIKDANEKSE